MGKKELSAILEKYIEKPPGAPVLVPVTDKRMELKTAAALEAFSEDLDKKEEEKSK